MPGRGNSLGLDTIAGGDGIRCGGVSWKRPSGTSSPGGTRSVMRASIRALRVHQRVGAEPLDRRRGRQDGSRVTAGLDEPAHQVLVRLRLFPLRRGSRSTSSRATPPGKDRNPYKTAQFGQMLVPGLGPHRVVGELVPVQVELAAAAGPPPVAVGRRTCRPAAWACGCSPARACRSTPRPRPAASCSASSRRWPSSSGS